MTAGIIGFARVEMSVKGHARGHHVCDVGRIDPPPPSNTSAPTANVFSHSEFD